MPTATYDSFTTDSFEQLVRAISIKTLGPGVTIFGNGPDGGREATFKGRVPYPYPPASEWDGYGVLQAKFKEKREDTSTEQTWAERELKKELKTWVESATRSPKPDYFVFCTNVFLTSTPSGGRKKLSDILEEHKKHGLKDFAIWDGNQLSTFVDAYEEVRVRFETFFTTGDLLAGFSKYLKTQLPDAEAVLTAYLCREISVDEDARISQAGDRSEDRVRLANVFFDLPVSSSPMLDPPSNGEANSEVTCALQELMSASCIKLDPVALDDMKNASIASVTTTKAGRFVYLGGPGSGKSTIGQFFAQVHRAALLSKRPPARLDTRIRAIISSIQQRCIEDSLPCPKVPRYPFRVELNAFAKALSKDGQQGVTTLSGYLRRLLSRDSDIPHSVLRDWLKLYPWLLILDGLDEVPATSNRREVVAAIQEFMNEAHDVEADLMIVASSRPDGYAEEFAGEQVAQRFLVPLTKAQALSCARRYVESKSLIKDASDQRNVEAMALLQSAVENPLVERLMRSPLQVTFMVTVVSASGKPSESRWQLFNDYYRTIYERELHKAVRPFDKVLNERRPDIDALHHRVGFILQSLAESSGGTQSDMSVAEFEQLVLLCLSENGLAGVELAEQKQKIVDAANLRLVFLTSRVPNRLSFDVRSLQEYMAAACITNADSALVVQRLKALATSIYWRNTLLFAIGRFFVEPQMRDHRDLIRVLCEDLNKEFPEHSKAKLGSRIAIDILESGVVGNTPLVNRSLASTALEILCLPPHRGEMTIERLVRIYDTKLREEYEHATRVWIGQSDPGKTLSAWALLLRLESAGVDWAVRLIEASFPLAAQHAFDIFVAFFSSQNKTVKLTKAQSARLCGILPKIAPLVCLRAIALTNFTPDDMAPKWLSSLMRMTAQDEGPSGPAVKLLSNGVRLSTDVYLQSVEDQKETVDGLQAIVQEQGVHDGWKVFTKIQGFLEFPSRATFQSVLVTALHLLQDAKHLSSYVPWPVAHGLAVMRCAGEVEVLRQLEQMSDEVFSAWIKREGEWFKHGVELSELFSNAPQLLGLDPSCVSSWSTQHIRPSTGNQLMDSERILNHLKTREVVFDVDYQECRLLFFVSVVHECLQNLPGKLLLEQVQRNNEHLQFGDVWFGQPPGNEVDWVEFMDYFGRNALFQPVGNSLFRSLDFLLDWLANAYSTDQTRVGLLRLLCMYSVCGKSANVALVSWSTLKDEAPNDLKLLQLLFRLTLAAGGDERPLLTEALRELGKQPEEKTVKLIMTFLQNHGHRIDGAPLLIDALIAPGMKSNWLVQGELESLRASLLQAKASMLDANRLKLPRLPAAS